MLIALIVFGPFLGAAAAAVIGKHNEKAGDYTALFVALITFGVISRRHATRRSSSSIKCICRLATCRRYSM